METRSLAIGLVAVVAAFAAAFGVAKSGGSKTATETAGAGVKAQSINVSAPAAVAGVEVGGTLPALKAVHKAPAKKKAKKPAASTNNSQSSSSSTQESTPPSSQQTAPPSTSQPSSPAPSAPKPSAPKPSAPKPSAPVSGGGEDG
jgi:hypothetical protein